MAFDEKGDQKKRTWILNLAEPSNDLSQYEINLEVGTGRADVSVAGADSCKRAIRSLLANSHKPLLLPQFESAGHGLLNSAIAEFTVDSTPDERSTQLELSNSSSNLYRFTIKESATPPETALESRAISFQSAEDHQFLPYSWNRPRPDELVILGKELKRQLTNDNAADKLLAAITVIALLCHRSLDTVSTVRLGKYSSEHWQLDPDSLVLHKTPTRRQNNWQPIGDSIEWVQKSSERWDLTLLDPVAQILRNQLRKTVNPKLLTDLWTQTFSESLEGAFNKWCKGTDGLGRLSSGMIARSSEQTAYRETLDHLFADMLTRPSNSGITGGGSYASWGQTLVNKTLTAIAPDQLIATPEDDPDSNALGSKLDPLEALLIATIGTAKEKILNPTHPTEPPWVWQHNLITGYTVAMLLAATGARPVTSIFETAAHFNLDEKLLYIEDKVSPLSTPGRAGRIIPLPTQAIALLQDVYFPHLQRLAVGLPAILKEFADEIQDQISGKGSSKLPLFFFLRYKPDFGWTQVNESSLTSLNLFAWPLPWNLFRHRLAMKLRRIGLDVEIIDAQLGHAEAGSETYGDFSTRCWIDDRKIWSTALDSAFESLDPLFPALPAIPITKVTVPSSYAPFPDDAYFGQKAREDRRKRLKKNVQKQTLLEINSAIKDRPIESISAEEWETLGTQMLLREGNIPQANALIRYETYESFLQSVWRTTGMRPRIRSWVNRRPTARTAFSPVAVHAAKTLTKIRESVEAAFANTYPRHLPKSTCGALAAIDVCITSRVCDRDVIASILKGDVEHACIVYKGGNAFLEYSDVDSKIKDRPVVRFIIPREGLQNPSS